MHKISSLQAARGLAALAVIAFHSIFINAKYVTGATWLPDMFVFGQTGVDLFFVISGFVMVLASASKFGFRGEVYNFLKGRFLRIYPVYWIYFFAVLLVFLLKPGMVNSSQGGEVNIVNSFLLLPDANLPLVMVAWSLIHEVWFYLVFAFILLLPRRLVPLAFVVWLCAIISVSVLYTGSVNPYLRVIKHEFSVEFILGALAGIFYLKVTGGSFKTRLPSALLGGLGLCLVAYEMLWGAIDGADVIQSISLERALIVGGGYMLILLALALREFESQWEVPGFLKSLGDMSYSLYLSHILTLSVCGRLWIAFGSAEGGLVASAIFWALSLPVVIVVGYVSYRFVECPLTKYLSQLGKNRTSSQQVAN
ncbi:acyltransferase family protein [Pseudomonas salomonii]|uniref:Peptidoglycan/LPS O-acetylase OafA/YrhL, contains acyltransferase and SGNH-hydrolase domains n=1 Tax=Pseudomonas salomonii TaxID=191391 RepID=A0A1H3KI35_9PSED|nr:acyltransferase [Pseudomonas salomonii]SDY51841.1 Peptidoglycan/LPS O-acetylase OafA/YrhL, contains acyltransferase and SGNH-hydrolase domains [Pseudomonas salomonii]